METKSTWKSGIWVQMKKKPSSAVSIGDFPQPVVLGDTQLKQLYLTMYTAGL